MYGQTLLVDLLGMHCQVKEWTPLKSALLMAIHADSGLMNRLYIERALIIDFHCSTLELRPISQPPQSHNHHDTRDNYVEQNEET
jgi:hypothetical protein